MSRNYIAFDIETAKILPEGGNDLRAHRPLGICCTATLDARSGQTRLWHGKQEDGSPAPKMTKADLLELVEHLSGLVDEGCTILTWNGLGFDFDILAEESQLWDECRRLARHHVDMMFHAFCELGYPIGLGAASDGMGLKGKSKTVNGSMAPKLWAEGKADEVLAYVAQDVQATLDLALACERRRGLTWITSKGYPKDLRLRDGWLTVEQAAQLPEPDTSWMSNPIPRSRFTGWLEAH